MMMVAVRKSTNWFAIAVTAAVLVVVLIVAGVVWFANSQATSPGTLPESSAINTETGAIAVGSGEKTVDTYIDFMCPVCNQFEQAYGPTLDQLVASDEITLNIHPDLDPRSRLPGHRVLHTLRFGGLLRRRGRPRQRARVREGSLRAAAVGEHRRSG